MNSATPSSDPSIEARISNLKELKAGLSYHVVTNCGTAKTPHWTHAVRKVVRATRASVTFRDPTGEFTGTLKFTFKSIGKEEHFATRFHSAGELN